MPLSIAREGFYDSSQDEPLASAARTASGQSDQFNVGGIASGMVVEILVTAASGTSPTLDLDLEDSFDGTTWHKVVDVNAANITAVGNTIKRINLRDTPTTNRLRLNYTIGGTTPSFTFSVRTYTTRG